MQGQDFQALVLNLVLEPIDFRIAFDHDVRELAASEGVAVETPPVRVLDERQVSWRIRPIRGGSAQLRFTVDGQPVTKTVVSGSAPGFVPGRSVSSTLAALWDPDEKRIPSAAVEWIEIRYPAAGIEVLDQDESHACIYRQGVEHLAKSLESSGRGADAHDWKGYLTDGTSLGSLNGCFFPGRHSCSANVVSMLMVIQSPDNHEASRVGSAKFSQKQSG